MTNNKQRITNLLLPLIFCLLTFLAGCVRYEVGVNFEDQHRGEIVQHIKLSEQLTTLSQAEATKWLDSIERRAKQLQGKTETISPQEVIVTIPFSNGQDLTKKFNRFFNPNPPASQSIKKEPTDLVKLNSQMSLVQRNWLLLEQNRLSLDVDLRALGVLSNQGNIIVSPGSLIDLEFALNTPWGGRSLSHENSLTPALSAAKNQLVWQLQAGQVNHIEAVFWVPSFLGIGTVGIVVLMLVSFYLKYKRFPWSQETMNKKLA